MQLKDGYYWVWFYNNDAPIIMLRTCGVWEAFMSDGVPSDEIDYTERPPRLVRLA